MDRFFDLLVLATLFAPVALIVAGNLAAYRSPLRGEGLFGAYQPMPRETPVAAAAEAAWEGEDLRRAA